MGCRPFQHLLHHVVSLSLGPRTAPPLTRAAWRQGRQRQVHLAGFIFINRPTCTGAMVLGVCFLPVRVLSAYTLAISQNAKEMRSADLCTPRLRNSSCIRDMALFAKSLGISLWSPFESSGTGRPAAAQSPLAVPGPAAAQQLMSEGVHARAPDMAASPNQRLAQKPGCRAGHAPNGPE